MIEAFKHRRPILYVDGTFLTGMYKAQLPICIGIDADGKVAPLTFLLSNQRMRIACCGFFFH
jgi:hypothetical protein